MKVEYEEQKDNRINSRRSFVKEYLIVFAVVLWCCSGSVLIFNAQMQQNADPWFMVLIGSSYVLFIGVVVYVGIKILIRSSFTKPIHEIRKVARKVAEGDFTVRVHSQRKDDKKDEVEILIDDFNKMIEELASIETLKGDFITNISHEIKTPLAVIQNYASVMLKESLPIDKRMEYTDTILVASKKLSTLVTTVLKLNKLDNQEIIKKNTYSLDEQLRCSILALEEKFEEKDVMLDVELDEVMITTDENLMEMVWNNLLTNSIKFTESKGTVRIKLKKENGKIIVSISDTGCGMSKKTVEHVFDRFYQGDTSHSSVGNGLGLSLVKRIIDLVEGKIKVDSECGKGTDFTVTLKEN
ncbi:HAMP domain-containing histidine kinase [Clostridium estertheticum]|uniref:HAMP domain-containing sensor histidine kinase n=1 Tax=Clostridium estertheticum TaxID=238834 RepID=UPI001C0B2AA6|nr:HAMP domain-containing sensor histidine kinase [Clostridium estertheticum]MBU3178351.1 HAMP domain-containing histidine kinase [Clostridium estertheticum]